MRVKSRQRSVEFDGKTITITVPTKRLNRIKNRLPVDKVKIEHRKPTVWQPGRLRFTAPGVTGHPDVKLPWLSDKDDQFTIVYGSGKQKEIEQFLSAVKRAKG
ncbi:hypothetical protein [Amycolatopsis sp. NPDC059657]|uniref:hypothetical protein n=1 Tax=Amycolatopsis sp. NPDC059657 TaxID=3346899 RepID=UPI00366DA897